MQQGYRPRAAGANLFDHLPIPLPVHLRDDLGARTSHAGPMTTYLEQQPDRADIDATSGPAVVIFGTNWCGFCLAAERYIAPALAEHPDVPVHAVEDGKGRALGRSYGVKLWPTLIFLRDGEEVARVVRPTSRGPLDDALAAITEGDDDVRVG